ncbi:hypothetical protein SAMN04487760_10471 [Lachnospiraceae bacterium G41]|nr:hypothetical protein SAMN04487760_10471 [Lachnospiraceae bacterium G41]
MDKNIPIVVVAFNRAKSLQRLLNSLNNAIYENDNIPLIISIDKGENQDVLRVAEDFIWKYGEKKVVYQSENLKLRRHVLKCGDYSLEYGNVIVLEDDLLVSKYFYLYSIAALNFSREEDRIGGVSLYNHRFNVEAFEPFEYYEDEYDNWYFQFASSWGEAWTKEQWVAFKKWYDNNPQINDRIEVPEYVRGWSNSSWLKYFISYLVETDKYFIFPKKSLTTNFGEAGTHVKNNNTDYQVPLQNGSVLYRFSKLDQSQAIYDSFFENIRIKNKFVEYGFDVTVDLYGKKPIELVTTRYLLTRRILSKKVIKSYGCCMRPHEDNIIYDISGNDFFLYDLYELGKKPPKDRIRKTQYNLRYVDRTQYLDVIKMIIRKTKERLIRRLMKNN